MRTRMTVRAAIVIFMFCAHHAIALSDALWQKAVNVSRRNKVWVPGITVMRVELLDEKGIVKESYDSVFRLSPDGDGNPELHVEKAVRNGSDVTEKEREAQEKKNRDAKKSGKPEGLNFGDDPFNPEIQDSIEATPLGETRVVGDRTCALYSFTMKKKDGTALEGTAALEKEKGTPVEVTYTMKPLPVGAQSLTTVLRFGAGPDGDGYLREVSIDGSGAFLFIKRVFKTLFSLDGYWKKRSS